MPFKVYVDSRFRQETGGSSSDSEFTVELPHPIQVSVLVAELLHQLQIAFPLAQTKVTNGYQWLGAIAYVDDLVLISKSPLELQQMINTCQTWCEKSRIEINASKTKIVVFNPKHIPPPTRQHANQHHWHLQPSFPAAHCVALEQVQYVTAE